MKNIIKSSGLLLGYVLLGVFFTSIVVSKYESNQQVQASANSQQTQLVNKTESSLQAKVAAAQATVKSLSAQVTAAKQQVSESNQLACADLTTANNQLSKYHLQATLPSFCQ